MHKQSKVISGKVSIDTNVEKKFDENENVFIAGRIKDSCLKTRKLSLPLNTTTDSVMRALIPGRYYYEVNNDTVRTVAWISDNHSDIKKKDPESDDAEGAFDFPDPGFNQTRIVDTIHFKTANGKDYLLLSLSTSNHNESFITGRFSCAYLGAALFIKEGNYLHLKSFNPAIECVGQFGYVPHLKMLKVSDKDLILYFSNPTGGLLMYETDLYVLRFANNYWKTYLVQRDAGYGNGDDESEMVFYFEPVKRIHTAIDSSEDFNLYTSGHILHPDKLDSSTVPLGYFPAKLVNKLFNSKADSIHFQFNTIYHFTGKNYKIINQTILESGKALDLK